jgi:hypothetical protein
MTDANLTPKAFENEKMPCYNSRGEPKKASSVWFLTPEALRHGVQSTTRYRKTGRTRKTGIGGTPDELRQRSGRKGGRRREEIPASWTSSIPAPDSDGLSSLANAASFMQDFSGNYDSCASTPSEYPPFTPRSPIYGTPYPMFEHIGDKSNTGGVMGKVLGQDYQFQTHFEPGMGRMY